MRVDGYSGVKVRQGESRIATERRRSSREYYSNLSTTGECAVCFSFRYCYKRMWLESCMLSLYGEFAVDISPFFMSLFRSVLFMPSVTVLVFCQHLFVTAVAHFNAFLFNVIIILISSHFNNFSFGFNLCRLFNLLTNLCFPVFMLIFSLLSVFPFLKMSLS